MRVEFLDDPTRSIVRNVKVRVPGGCCSVPRNGAGACARGSGARANGRVQPGKKWGKKSKKFRDKDPYAETEKDVFGDRKALTLGSKSKAQGARTDGSTITRMVLPHHPTYAGPVDTRT